MSDDGSDGSDAENQTSQGEESSCVDSLDEWGWDPWVDEFLLEVVGEAPRRGTAIDFTWVSQQFMETLEPSEEQWESAAERFAPGALQERWLFLVHQQYQDLQRQDALGQQEQLPVRDLQGQLRAQQKQQREEQRGVASSQERAPAGENESHPKAIHTDAAVLASSSSIIDHSESMNAASSSSDTTLIFASCQPSPPSRKTVEPLTDEDLDPAAPRQKKDRVLDAMQRFFMGRPSPGKNPVASPATAPATPPVAQLATPPATPPAAAKHSTLADGTSASAKSGNVGQSKATDASEAAEDSSPFDATLTSGTAGEALRRCLDELRWHGEALRLASTGEDAAALNTEAAERRRTLLFSLAGLQL